MAEYGRPMVRNGGTEIVGEIVGRDQGGSPAPQGRSACASWGDRDDVPDPRSQLITPQWLRSTFKGT